MTDLLLQLLIDLITRRILVLIYWTPRVILFSLFEQTHPSSYMLFLEFDFISVKKKKRKKKKKKKGFVSRN